MPTPEVARRAAATRKKVEARQRELIRQGMSADAAEDQARKEHRLKPKKRKPSASPSVGPAIRGTVGQPTPVSSPAPQPAAPQPATPQPQAASQPSTMQQTATASVPVDIESRLRTMALLVKPTWEVDAKKKVFRCWRTPGGPIVELPIAAKPGPFTPKENLYDILGQADMLFAICVAIKKDLYWILEGPTGTAKTAIHRWLAKQLNWNVIPIPISRGTEAAHLVGEYLPSESKDGKVRFEWTWGMLSSAVIASQTHDTIAVFEELNRIGNIQELARVYSLLDDTRMLEIKEKRGKSGVAEVLRPGRLHVGGTMNPADSEAADYIGVQELDPALRRRFHLAPTISYPPEEIEAEALRRRVKGLTPDDALRMVKVATRVRQAESIRFPFSFPDLVAWATVLPYYDWEDAAEVAVVQKAHPDYRKSIRDLIQLAPRGAA